MLRLRTGVLMGVLAALSTFNSACSRVQSYLAPIAEPFTIAVHPSDESPRPLRLRVSMQQNGVVQGERAVYLYALVREALQETGRFVVVKGDAYTQVDQLVIVLNNNSDLAEAKRKGFVNGLSFGILGTQIEDEYIYQASYTAFSQPSADPVTLTIRRLLLTNIGNRAIPNDVAPQTPQQALAQLIRECTLAWVNHHQHEATR